MLGESGYPSRHGAGVCAKTDKHTGVVNRLQVLLVHGKVRLVLRCLRILVYLLGVSITGERVEQHREDRVLEEIKLHEAGMLGVDVERLVDGKGGNVPDTSALHGCN